MAALLVVLIFGEIHLTVADTVCKRNYIILISDQRYSFYLLYSR